MTHVDRGSTYYERETSSDELQQKGSLMSWNAYFSVQADGQFIRYGQWDYTHNCNRMANETLPKRCRDSWYRVLDGMSGQEGAELLGTITSQLGSDPDKYRAMNPENGWGDFDSFYRTLMEMQQASEQFPSGHWRMSF